MLVGDVCIRAPSPPPPSARHLVLLREPKSCEKGRAAGEVDDSSFLFFAKMYLVEIPRVVFHSLSKKNFCFVHTTPINTSNTRSRAVLRWEATDIALLA